MRINVRMSAGLAHVTGQPRLTLTLHDGATVAAAVAQLVAQQPELAGPLQRALPMARGQHIDQQTVLQDGEELLLLLPAAGGCTMGTCSGSEKPYRKDAEGAKLLH